MENQETLISYQECARRFGFKLNTLYGLVHKRKIPHVRLSPRMVKFRLSDLLRWADEHRVAVDDKREGGTVQ